MLTAKKKAKAKAKVTTKKKAKAKDELSLDVPVKYGRFGTGDHSAAISVQIDRAQMGYAQAEHFLCGSRLAATLVLDAHAGKDVENQEQFAQASTVEATLSATIDIPSFRATPRRFTAQLSFARKEVDLGQLAQFAERAGRLGGYRLGPSGGKKDDEHEDGDQYPLVDDDQQALATAR